MNERLIKQTGAIKRKVNPTRPRTLTNKTQSLMKEYVSFLSNKSNPGKWEQTQNTIKKNSEILVHENTTCYQTYWMTLKVGYHQLTNNQNQLLAPNSKRRVKQRSTNK